jgi:hypothetical protein
MGVGGQRHAPAALLLVPIVIQLHLRLKQVVVNEGTTRCRNT